MNTIHASYSQFLLFSGPELEWLLFSDRALFVRNAFEHAYDFVHYADAEEVLQLRREAESCSA